MLLDMLDCFAWRVMSHGAKILYVSLKRRSWENRAYLSYRDAMRELRASQYKVKEWFAELAHYGFIVMITPGCLGVDGKGKAPHWRLTEKGRTGTVTGELPTKEYLRWNGTAFDPKPYRDRRGPRRWVEKQNPALDGGYTPYWTADTPLYRTGDTQKSESVVDGLNIGGDQGVSDGEHISSLTTGDSGWHPPSSSSETFRTIVGRFWSEASTHRHTGCYRETVESTEEPQWKTWLVFRFASILGGRDETDTSANRTPACSGESTSRDYAGAIGRTSGPARQQRTLYGTATEDHHGLF